MPALLAANWWAIALRGVAAMLFGVLTLLLPGVSVAALVLLVLAFRIRSLGAEQAKPLRRAA